MKRIKFIIVVLLILRVVFAFTTFHPDLNNHIDWGIRFFEYGPSKVFLPESNVWSFTWPNQPPGTLYMFAGIRKIYEFLFGIIWWINLKLPAFPSVLVSYFEKTLYPALLQFPAIFADFGIAWLIFKIISKHLDIPAKKKKKLATIGAIVFLANPVVWYNSSVWGQYDSVINFFVLLSAYFLLEKRLTKAIFFFLLSIYTKASLLIFAPVFAVYAIKQKYKLKEYLKGLVVSFAVFGLITLPFSSEEPFSWLYWLYTKKVFVQQLHLITANAFNIWAFIAGIHERPDSLMFGPLSYKTWGILLYIASYVPALYYLLKKKTKEGLFWAMAMVAFSTFMLLTNMHERYIYPLFPALTILYVKNKKIRPFYWIVSSIALINMWHFWWVPNIVFLVNFIGIGNRVIPRILGLVNFGMFVYFYKFFLRQVKPTKI